MLLSRDSIHFSHDKVQTPHFGSQFCFGSIFDLGITKQHKKINLLFTNKKIKIKYEPFN